MAQTKSGSPHGALSVQFALLGNDGKAYGVAGGSQANNTVSGAYLAKYLKSCDMPIPDRNTIDFTSKDTWNGSFQYGISSLGSFSLTLENIDADLIALLSGSSVDQTTNALWTYFAENVLAETVPQVCVIVTYRIQIRGGVLDGGDRYAHAIIPKAWCAPKGVSGAPSFQTAGEYSIQVTPTASAIHPAGVPFSSMAMNLEDDRTPILTLFTDNPIHLATYVGDGTATTFTLPYLPLSEVVTVNNSPNEFNIDGTLTALSALASDTGVATLTAPVGSGTHSAILYETNHRTAA